MTDRDAFLAAIHAAPDDDAPRLVFSDWLEENSQPERAEFIRVQIEMHREYTAHGRPTRRLDNLFLRQKKLFARPWADVLRRCRAAAVATYSRGFSTAAFSMPAKTFAREADELAGWFGPETRLLLFQMSEAAEAVAVCHAMRWVGSLTLINGWQRRDLADADLKVFCLSPYLGSLRQLILTGPQPSGPSLTAASCVSLAEAPSLTGLRSLDLSFNRIGNDGAKVLAATERFAPLRSLNLRRTGVGRAGWEAILRSPLLTNLETLQASDDELSLAMRHRLEASFGPRLILYDAP